MVDVQIGIFAVYKSMAGIDLAVAGVVGILAAVFGEGCQAFFGSLSDSGHRKKLILGGMCLASAASFMGYTSNAYLLLGLLLLTFIGSAAFHPSAAGLVSSLSQRRGLYFTLFTSGGAFGLAISQILFYEVYNYLDGNTVILALPLFLLALGLLYFPIDVVSPPQRKKASFSAVLKLFQRADLRCLYYVQVCNQTLFWATIFLLPDTLVALGYEDWISYGGGHLAFILGGALMMVPGGILSDIYSPRKVMIVAMAVGLACFYLFLMMGHTDAFLLLGILAVLGAAFSLISPLGLVLGHRMLPDQPSLVSAFIMGMVWCVSESLAPASGILTKVFSEGNAPAQALMVMGILNFIGLWAALRLPIQAAEPATVPV